MTGASLGHTQERQSAFVLFLAWGWDQPELTWGLLFNSPSKITLLPDIQIHVWAPHIVDGKAEVQKGICSGYTVRTYSPPGFTDVEDRGLFE